jgi:hypothetical protein
MAPRSRVDTPAEPRLGFSATMRPAPVGQLQKIDFYSLPRPVQDRFVAATRRTAPPSPLLFQPAPKTGAWVCLGASALLVVMTVVLLRAGWGEASSPLAVHGAKMLALDVVLLAAAAWGVVHAMSILRGLDALPYRAGTYLFPACVVDARGPVLRVWRVAEADAVERVDAPAAIVLRMNHGAARILVPASSGEAAERVERALGSLRDELLRAIAEDDASSLAELDPLHDRALSSPIGPSEPMKRVVPPWARFDWAIAAGIGAVLGLGFGMTRNSMSDDAMFRACAESGTADAYRAYLDHGGKHSPEIRDELLPRADLAVAVSKGTVDAVEEFAQSHVGSKIQPEIDAAVRAAMLGELEKAKRVGTVSALDDIAHRYPDNKIGPELAAVRHTLYARASNAYKAKATPDAPTSALMDRVLAWAEKNGPACEVRFRERVSKSLDDADASAKKSNHYPGPDALPSRYLTAEALRVREQHVAQTVVQGFTDAFPTDVLSVRAGDPLGPDADAPKAIPTLLVEYAPEWSHVNTNSTRPPTLFAGFTFTFDTSFLVPDGAAPLALRTKVWARAELWRMKSDGMTREDFEQKVYDSMMDGTFDQLGKKLSDTFF